MKRFSLILLLCCVLPAVADDYVDDIYYSSDISLSEQIRNGSITPYFNKAKMQEVKFTQPAPDSIPTVLPDTIR